MAKLWLALPVLAVVGLLLTVWMMPPRDVAPVGDGLPLLSEDGSSIHVAAQPGVTAALWQQKPVFVLVASTSQLDAVNEARGDGAASEAIPLPGHPHLRVFALSGISTHRGCTIGWMPELGASRDIEDYDGDGRKDGRFLDKCHHGQWDAFHRGTPVPGTPAPARLAALQLKFVDGELRGFGFDGPTGGQR